MKKLLCTVALAFLTLAIGTQSLAQTITSLSQIDSKKKYLIRSNNDYGYCIYNPLISDYYATLGGGTQMHQAGNANPLYQQAIDPADPNCQWNIIRDSKGGYYLYNVGKKQYLTNKTTVTADFNGFTYNYTDYTDFYFTDEKNAFKIYGDKGIWNFRLQEISDYSYNAETKFLCAATQREQAITNWTQDDTGSSWIIEEASNIPVVHIQEITLNETALTMAPGTSITLTATVVPQNATYRNTLTWASSNPAVATVQGGIVTAVKAGKCVITVSSAEGNKVSAQCNIVVQEPEEEDETEPLGTLRYFTFVDGQLVVIPEKYIEERTTEDPYVHLTLTGDTVWSYDRRSLASEDTVLYAQMPEFESFKFNNKFNDQLYVDVDGVIDSTEHTITLAVPCIGKRLTPSFKVPDEASVWVNGKRQHSKVTRRRFDRDVTYTVAYPKNWIYRISKISDEVWSTPDERDPAEEWLFSPITLTTDMLSTNAPSNYPESQGLSFIVDGQEIGNYFHSTWGSGEYNKLAWSEGSTYGDGISEWPYIQVEPAEPIQSFRMSYVSGPADRRWTSFIIQGSNDGQQWDDLERYSEEKNGLPGYDFGTWTSPIITTEVPYAMLRLQTTGSYHKNYVTMTELKLEKVEANPDYGREDEFVPELLVKAQYAHDFVPYGTDYRVHVDYLTDHSTDQYSVPRIDINTKDGTMISSKTEYWDASFQITGNGVFEDLYIDSMQIRGRGNTSWTGSASGKNPYRLKFPSKIKPFGLTKGKNWVLLANRQSGSMTTNAVAMRIANMVGTAASNHIIPVELYINGDYRGSYNFTEKVGFGNNSIDLKDESRAVLLELDSYYDEPYKFRDACYDVYTNVKEPEFDAETSGSTLLTFEDIQMAFNNLTYEMKLGDWSKYAQEMIDVKSVATAMLVTDLTRNQELKHPKSWYIYNENLMADSLWVLGPVWDFDWAFGYDGTGQYYVYSAETDLLGDGTSSNIGLPFFKELFRGSEAIKKAYYREWTHFINDGKLDELLEFCDDYLDYANPSLVHNATKWSDGNSYTYITTNSKNWLAKRAQYIYAHLEPYDLNEDIIEIPEDEWGEPNRIDLSTLDDQAKLVDVYNLQGIRIRSQVPETRYHQGLIPGIYIVGGKKVVIR